MVGVGWHYRRESGPGSRGFGGGNRGLSLPLRITIEEVCKNT